MLKEVKEFKERCEKVEQFVSERIPNASSEKEQKILYHVSNAAKRLKYLTLLSLFAEHVRSNLETVKTLKISTPEADAYIKDIMGDTLIVSREFDGTQVYLGVSVLSAFFAFDVKEPEKEWETIADIEQFHRTYEPEEVEDIVTTAYNKAEELGIRRADVDKEEESLKTTYPELMPMLTFALTKGYTSGNVILKNKCS